MELSENYKCPICGKKFSIQCEPEEYGWNFGKILFCSYSCMRVVEKKYLQIANGISAERKRKIPCEYKDIWLELLKLRDYLRGYERLRRMLYRDKANEKYIAEIRKSMQGFCKRITPIKAKYAVGVAKLDKKKYLLLYRYILSGWEGERIISDSGLSYNELCEEYISILKTLKHNLGDKQVRLTRWICRQTA